MLPSLSWLLRCIAVTVALDVVFHGLVSAAEKPSTEGLVLWLDATDVDRADSSEPVAGARVSQWSDKSGRGNHIAQPDEAKQPAVVAEQLSGRSVVRFDGDDLLTRDKFAGFTYRDQPIHMIVVMQSREGAQPRSRVIEFQPLDGDLSKPATVKQHGFWIGPRGDGRMRLGTHYGDEGSALTNAFDAMPHVVEVVYAGAQGWVHYLDGARDGAGLLGDRDFHGFTKDLRLAIGQQYGSTDTDTFFEGDLAEVLVYDRELSVDEQNKVKSYLAEKWSLDLSIEAAPRFEQDILPILAQHCHECHGAETRESDVDLRTVTAMLRGGKSGPVISRGHPEFSDLVEQVVSGKMPPDDAEPLAEEQIATLRRWIAAGAPADEQIKAVTGADLITDKDRAFWAFQKLKVHEPPQVGNNGRVRTPIDAFMLDKLEQHNLAYAPDADKLTILRRAYFDLIGLPPSPEEITAFLFDESPDAYERLIDRLLTSRHFGERWGRSWLDWSGYVDVYGRDNDTAIIKPLKGRWRYRDYVIRAFNNDKPFDRFLVEQLAGDELVDWRNAEQFTPEMVELLTATGFLMNADDDSDQNELNTPDIRHYVLQHTGEVVANNLFALTVQCAKCHNHKYEAIPQLDYYQWLSNFSPVFNPQRWVTSVEHGIADVSSVEKQAIDTRNAEIDGEVAGLTKKRDGIRAAQRQKLLDEKLTKLPEPIRADLKTAVETAADKRNEVQKYLADKLGAQINVTPQDVEGALSDADKTAIADADKKIGELNSQKRSYGTIQVAVEQSPPSPTYLLRRGEVTKPGVEVQPTSLSVLTDVGHVSNLPDDDLQPRGATSGRRLTIAKQVTDPDSIAGHLVARVFVNRIWQELYGKGIVETSDNFGVSGSRPTHPELLDWLASDFISSGWKVKSLIKQMMMSSAYRQSSIRADVAAAEKADLANNLLWRARLRRLPSEYVRDRVLAVSGQLNPQLFGPPTPLLPRPDGKIVIKMDALPSPTAHLRRSIYVLIRRNYHLSMLTTFDQPFLTSNCTIRQPSAVVTQSLTMMNDDFVIEQSSAFADRVAKEASDATAVARVDKAYQLALCRAPRENEKQLCVDLIARHTERYQQADMSAEEASRKALAHFCHTLFNTNEFLYVQ